MAPRSPRGRRSPRQTTRRARVRPLIADNRESEVEAYQFIRTQLAELGWDVRNPERNAAGEVWTQNQCLSHPELQRCLGSMRPENIVKLSETSVWVIEAKSRRGALQQALREAEHDYAWKIQNAGVLTAPIISGVAGNEGTGYEIRTRLLVNGSYRPVTINGAEATGLLDRQTIRRLVETGNPDIADLPIDEEMFLRAAEQINRTLHAGGINKNDRARVMAALLLALLEGNGPDLEADLPVLIADINSRSEQVLRRHGKREFCPFVHIEPPTNSENHLKYKAAIVRTLQTLTNLSIKSAMNSGADVLGKFYEVFLKYGNGAKEIGIVLTPRHLTRFAVDAVGVSPADIVFDPACGTGGFLVAAFDHVRRRASVQQIDRFKRHNLFGIEQESAVAALAIVNMIFRGDGKNNIVEANCFSRFLRAATTDGHPSARYVNAEPPPGEEGVTRVFMNPPFALKETDARESRFVDAGLKSMADGGKLFAVLPLSVMSEANPWRRESLLAHHTLLAVLSLPEEMFYPVANQTVVVIVEKGRPHPQGRPVLWGRIERDGFMKSKARRFPTPPEVPNDLNRIAPTLRAFLVDGTAPVTEEPEFLRVAPIDHDDPLLELVPAAYLRSAVPDVATLNSRLDRQVRDNIAALVDLDLRHGSGERTGILDAPRVAQRPTPFAGALKFAEFRVDAIFDLMAGDYHSLSETPAGTMPMVSCADYGNGVIGTYAVPPEAIFRDCLTIAFNGAPLTTKLHPYEFAAKDDVAVAVPRFPLPPEALIFIQATLNSERWRFSYYRKCFRAKLERLPLELPVKDDGSLDIDGMVRAVQGQPYWPTLAPRLHPWGPLSPNRKPRRKPAKETSP